MTSGDLAAVDHFWCCDVCVPSGPDDDSNNKNNSNDSNDNKKKKKTELAPEAAGVHFCEAAYICSSW